jgi:hypothetical protein
VFELLRGDSCTILSHKPKLNAYRTIYHYNYVEDDNEFTMNSMREEGIEIKYDGTDFGLEEVIVTKIK